MDVLLAPCAMWDDNDDCEDAFIVRDYVVKNENGIPLPILDELEWPIHVSVLEPNEHVNSANEPPRKRSRRTLLSIMTTMSTLSTSLYNYPV